LFFAAGSIEVRVYNYEHDKWSTWSSEVLNGKVKTAHVLPHDSDIAVTWSEQASKGSYLDSDSVTSTASAMAVQTSWIAPGGDLQDDVEIDRIIFNGEHDGGSHDLGIFVNVDYATGNTPAVAIANSTLVALAGSNVDGKYSLRVQPTNDAGCRVFRLLMVDQLSSGGGMDPRHVTVVYRLLGVMHEEAFLAGGDV
jgi:hypothetical protein